MSTAAANSKIHPEPNISDKPTLPEENKAPPVDWSTVDTIRVKSLSGDEVPLRSLCEGKKTIFVFLRRFDCATCYSYIVLFSHLQPIINQTGVRVVFFTCHQDLSEVQVFLRSFAFWLRDLKRQNGTENDSSSSAIPGELYLDPCRDAYRFFGLTLNVLPIQQNVIYMTLRLMNLYLNHIGKNPRPRPKLRTRGAIFRDARQYVWAEFRAQVDRSRDYSVYNQSPGIAVVQDCKLLYRYVCRDQNILLPDSSKLGQALQCELAPTKELDAAVVKGMENFMDAVSTREAKGQIKSEELPLKQKLGHGRESEVYKSSWMGIDVAVKFFRFLNNSNNNSKKDDPLVSFSNEAALLMSLRHPNIISFIGFGSKPPHHFMIMEFMSRGSLFETLANKDVTLSQEVKKGILLGCAKGMAFLHGCTPQVIHSDLKSLNVLVDDSFTIKIADFGIAKEIREVNEISEDVNEEERGQGGTLQWMPPEVIKAWTKEFTHLVSQCWHQDPRKRIEFSKIVKALDGVTVPE
ncbi:hypothetical protein HDV05_002888 [Chytridiales sp. JEL 0842]|nr:hypothetical protein HDV05_002888 [Chytridiales sp. JEL 0842]